VLRATKTEQQLSLLRLFETTKQMKVCPSILFADAKWRHRRNKQLLNSARVL